MFLKSSWKQRNLSPSNPREKSINHIDRWVHLFYYNYKIQMTLEVYIEVFKNYFFHFPQMKKKKTIY